jgi:beta-lactamase regulating signal transducer with metallopeptidase domain
VSALLFHWLLTYFVHSTCLLSGAAALDWRRRLTRRGVGTWPWRVALFGGFITSALQSIFFFSGVQADWGSPAADPAAVMPAAFTPTVSLTLGGDLDDLAPLILIGWLAVVSTALLYLLTRLRRLLRDIRHLPAVRSAALVRVAAQLSACAGVSPPQLRIAAQLSVPLVAPGAVICIPAWMYDGYEPRRLHAALAHEIAHLKRHDNLWRIAARIAAVVGWVQPLNRLALRRLDESAEIACDAWAASATGLRYELAECLRDCAQRLSPSHAGSAFTVAMAGPPTPLLERVVQLLEGPDMKLKHFRRSALWSSAVLAALAAAGIFVVVATIDDDVPPRWLAKAGWYQSLQNSGERVHTSRSVVIDSPERYVYIRVTGQLSLASGTPGGPAGEGTAILAETREGVTRSVRFERQANRSLTRVYKIDGNTHELDEEGNRWLDTMLPLASL